MIGAGWWWFVLDRRTLAAWLMIVIGVSLIVAALVLGWRRSRSELFVIPVVDCPACDGRGWRGDYEYRCDSCHGTGIRFVGERLS